MAETDHRDLLTAMAAELADIRAEIEATGGLVSEVLRQLPPETRLGYLTRSQTFDVLTQRVEALAGLAQAVAEDQPMDTALAALPLAEMAERMQETTHRARRPAADADGDEPARAAGELHLF
ncbi:hypothetical protein NI456_11955 [Brevundimonas diminuta]|uniref:hypothetical protein n=1 Tax=Brevundimonas diminuta TaxID=293 RepID=UPI002097D41B|nr:hypothetical protein [Brevundimonas diminuta]MCO8019570.1 hypothetical protein [Brevundimonas diminuta]MCO8022652.1 hypothetical protein [Brevundimonas diminuta]